MVLPQVHWNFLGAKLVQDCCRQYYVFTRHGVFSVSLKILEELEVTEWLATIYTPADMILRQSLPDVQQAVMPGMRHHLSCTRSAAYARSTTAGFATSVAGEDYTHVNRRQELVIAKS
jgi:hypothetical protein